MQNSNRKKGFSLSETLIVIGIIAVLAALIVIAVFAYLRSLTKLEYDGYAKELFIASQNHLSMAESQGYLGRTYYGTEEADGIYYFVKTGGRDDVNDGNSVLNLMLPFAAVDETVREGGCYVVRYHKDSATVLDVFYWEEGGRYPHTFQSGNYTDFLNKRDDKSELRTYEEDRSVIGWYGGADAQGLTHGDEILTPLLSVTNADQLTVTVTDRMPSGNANIRLKLIITGLTSGNQREIVIDRNLGSEQTFVLDSITDGDHFSQKYCTGEHALIPGEDITLQAVEYNNAELTNVAYSPIATTNSLFAYNDSGSPSAHISYIRHLENLDPSVSNLDTTTAGLKHVTDEEITATQTTDLTWDTNKYQQITGSTGSTLVQDHFKPVDTTGYKLIYNGQSFAINSVDVDAGSGSAGLFSDLTEGDTVRNLKLVDCTVTGGQAGALAGTATSAIVENVVAYNASNQTTDPTIRGSESAGALIGTATGTGVYRCAGALIVESSSGNAGGLIGTASGGSVTASYSGGHTKDGSYRQYTYQDANDNNETKIRYNVTGAENAGGLIGKATGTAISDSYSTCSVKATGTDAYAGGLIGNATGSALTVSNAYSTGLVDAKHAGALIGTLTDGSLSDCWYYEIINEQPVNGQDGTSGYQYMDPVGDQSTSVINQNGEKIRKIDENAQSYDDFVGADTTWTPAISYDLTLNFYYQGQFNLQTVDQLSGMSQDDLVSNHYGDWPAPEIWTINVPTP